MTALKSNGIDHAVERKFDPVAVEKAAGILNMLRCRRSFNFSLSVVFQTRVRLD